MINLYLYPNAQAHTQDEMPGFGNLVPFSKVGIEKHCNLVAPEKADYFYMGQFRDCYGQPNEIVPAIENFPYFKDKAYNHIADIEGDWKDREVPGWLEEAFLTVNSTHDASKEIFVRPTFTKFLVHCARERHELFPIRNPLFSFIGYPDPYGIRRKMCDAFIAAKLSGNIFLNSRWMGPSALGSEHLTRYEEVMLSGGIALCPRGCGKDSARFYEACFFGRAPVLIGDNRLLGDTEHDMSFVFKISQYSSVEEIAEKLQAIAKMPLAAIQWHGKLAREYFDNVFRKYVEDPTAYFIERAL
jgi:hypothetical protein